jgi:serine protease AprX
MATARAAQRPDGKSAYSVFQQGAGIVNAHDAVYEGHSGCANGGLDIERDLAGVEHYGGPVSQDASGTFFLLDANGDGTQWAGNFTNNDGFPWSNGYPWADGYPWANGYPWSDSYPWANGYPWATGFPWSSSLADPASVNAWVPQE